MQRINIKIRNFLVVALLALWTYSFFHTHEPHAEDLHHEHETCNFCMLVASTPQTTLLPEKISLKQNLALEIQILSEITKELVLYSFSPSIPRAPPV